MRTSLYEEHVRLGGRMVEFAGWELPVMYSSIIEEHVATRTKVGLFDVSHMGEFVIRGRGAEGLLRKLIPTRMDKLSPGGSMYSCFCNGRGGVVDDIFIFMVAPEDYYLVVNAATTQKDLAWIREHNDTGAEITNVSDETSKIDIQGPSSTEILKKVIPDPKIGDTARFHFFYSTFEGVRIMISRTGYTGENGYELFLENNAAPELWRRLIRAGEPYGLKPAGLGARDTLRLEASYSLYGHELGDDISPVEGGLKWLVNSADSFIAKDILVAQKEKGAPRELACFELAGRGVPREHCRMMKAGKEIGISTSGGYSPTFKKGIGMALVNTGSLKTGDECSIVLRESEIPAVVVPRPFYKFNG